MVKHRSKCAICLDSMKKNERYVLGCNHKFHKKCVQQLNDTRCPICRKDIEGIPEDTLDNLRERRCAYNRDMEEQATRGLLSSEGIDEYLIESIEEMFSDDLHILERIAEMLGIQDFSVIVFTGEMPEL